MLLGSSGLTFKVPGVPRDITDWAVPYIHSEWHSIKIDLLQTNTGSSSIKKNNKFIINNHFSDCVCYLSLVTTKCNYFINLDIV